MQCPNLECQAQWGIEEMSFQECNACGYPDLSEIVDYDEDEDEDEIMLECSNCSAMWGIEEISIQQCFACGCRYDYDNDGEADDDLYNSEIVDL